MKYKLIPSLAHNLTHSFMSGMNYVDDDHVYLDVYALARKKPGSVVAINWIPARANEPSSFPPRVRKSIVSYRGWLPQLMKRHKVRPEMIQALRTEVYLAKNFRIYVRAVAIDSRGKEYVKYVWA